MHTQINGFIVCQVLVNGGYQPVFKEDEILMVFHDHRSAEAEVRSCIKEIKQAIQQKNMPKDSLMSEHDYDIIAATIINPWESLPEQIVTCFFDGYFYKMKRSHDDWTNDNKTFDLICKF